MVITMLSTLYSRIINESNHNNISDELATITFTEEAPIIDGVLDDKEWLIASPILNFIQEEPDNLQPPTETTEVRLLYDNENIYVYVHLFDNEPDKIAGRFARRDDWFE